MAPEQLEGREADARSDVFALGCVLYEMSSGKRAFEGKTTASVIALIMNSEPAPLSTYAPLTPPSLDWAIHKCLAKDPEERWQSAGDLASELRWIQEGGSRAGVAVPAAARTKRRLVRWAVVVAAVVAGSVLGFIAKRTPTLPVLRAALNLPSGESIVPENGAALSPDGQSVVMTLADAQGKTKLWVRRLSSDTALPLDGTEGGIYPFWSPDSQSIAFFAVDGKLRKIPAAGGRAEGVCDLWQTYGGAWNRDGVIVFATGNKGLFQVPASGGTPVRIATPENTPSDYRRPQFLPDGKHILVNDNGGSGGISLVSLDTGQVQPVLASGSQAQYAEPGFLLFLQGTSLMAQPFDTRTLRVSGTAHLVAESVYYGPLSFSTTPGGLLLYQRAFQTQLVWIDPSGRNLSTVGNPGYLSAPYLSPDGKYAIVTVTDPRKGKVKLWLYDLTRGTSSPFTFGEGDDQYPAWSPDNRQVAFTSTRHGKEDIYVKAVTGGSDEQLLFSGEGNAESDRWSSDGRFLLFDYYPKANATDVWALPLFGERKPFPVAHTAANENWGMFSPDGKWVVYSSDETGRAEIYAVPFPSGNGKWQVSTSGGIISLWPPGKELFYMTPDNHIIGVELDVQGGNLVVGKSRQLFGGRAFGSSTGFYVTSDSKRWLVALPVEEPNASPLILTTNWTATLK
jgi:Tol biopolymer transport system component